MASTSTSSFNTECEPENAHTSGSGEIVSSTSTSATPSVGTLFSSCFSWCPFLLSLCSTKSHSVPFTSTSCTHAFDQVTPPPPTSTMMERNLPYDVFINHRGPDLKEGLATDIYKTLIGMGLRIFLDKEELNLGDFLPTEIQEAMRSAALHIAIFSKNYAQSPWCLAELSFMLKMSTQIVPVFYHIETADVRYAKGIYAEAFSEYEKKGRYTPEKLQEWKKALNHVSYNVGGIIHDEE